MNVILPSELARYAWRLYKKASYARRVLQALRPYICPFDVLLGHVHIEGSLLDIGTGCGNFAFFAANCRSVCRVVGVDVSEQAIVIARAVLRGLDAQHAKNIDFFVCVSPDEWPDSTFDTVTMIDVLHHVSVYEQDTFISEALKRVRPGGIFLYKDMCGSPFHLALANRLHDLLLARQWIHYKSFDQVESLILSSGFSIVAKRAKRCFWYGHEMIAAKRNSDARNMRL